MITTSNIAIHFLLIVLYVCGVFFIFQLQFVFKIILYSLQIYSIVARQSCTLQSGPPDSPSTHLAAHIVTVYRGLCSSCCNVSLCAYSTMTYLYFLIPSPFFTQAPSAPPLCQLSGSFLYNAVSILFV